MIRLLIVDDEPYTVDGLYEMLEEKTELELDLYRAYAPEEAMEWMARTRIDIVLSDVRMPGMNGLELQQWIVGQWPRCKIIFLTGIRDIEFAQQAIRTGSVDYILKTEGDEAIVCSIRKAIDAIAEEMRSDQFMREARQQLHRALPLLHLEWFRGLLANDTAAASPRMLQERMRELDIPLAAGMRVLPVIGRVDRWEEGTSPADRTLLMYAMQNIGAEYLQPVRLFAVIVDAAHFVWLVQPEAAGADGQEDEADATAAQWRQTASFVRGSLESVQETCRRLLKLTVSFVGAGRPASWRELPRAYDGMKKQLVLGLGDGVGMLMTAEQDGEPKGTEASRTVRSAVDTLARQLDGGLEDAFAHTLAELFAGLSRCRYAEYLQAYYAVAVLLMQHGGDGEYGDGGQPAIDPEALMNVAAHPTKDQALRYLQDAASVLFARRRRMQDERTHQLVAKLHRHIHERLNGDLSLTGLAETVYLNPSYLSVLYKQQTGRNISEYIAEARLEKAKELLAASPLKIHEIAEKVGFETAGYFTRFFRKHLDMTPQEYRNKSL